ncbi:hypothetical protein LTR36_007289 [Oleoguttula mirabilis]|uniref:Putative phospholipase n=1 Tax=Oleoguttula mirabilis TaxID=1507867 RepID=A0AAV9JA12_9PEZI|nr:hypothetical protein LTR36_007289 [Oleoguttula mirabilis]
MASLLTGWNPIKYFPEYHGPYDVGTVDLEIPAADLLSPCDTPDGAPPTIAFRMFYPCVKPAKGEADRPVRWIPQPQRIHIASVMKYVGIGEKTAGLASYLLRQLYWIRLPAHRNARMLEAPTESGRWPVTFFSHGLAGSRNAYSQICGDLASNGMIVISMDHRDGSSPIQYVRATATTEAHTVQPSRIPHAPMTDDVYEARDKQLRIRIWEMCMAYEALVKMDQGHNIQNLDSNTSRNPKERMEVLWRFNDMMDIHRPGKVTWSGHSFGAATMVQLLKSIFYYKDRTDSDGKPLITPNADAAVIQQIAPESPTLLLDMWSTPLKSPNQRFLWDRPLPSYASGGPNGANLLSILSESFQNWEDNLNINKEIVAKPSLSRRPSVAPMIIREKGRLLPAFARLRAPSPAADSGYGSAGSRDRSPTRQASHGSGLTTPSKASSSQASPERTGSSERTPGPHMFFVGMTQHFNQSDYGILFPYITQKTTKAEEPERCLELNVRAMVQVIRESGIQVGGQDDREILDKEGGVRKWIPIATAGDETDLQQSASRPGALSAINRKLSVSSTARPAGSERRATDGMTMGQKMEAQLQKQKAIEQLDTMAA